MISLFLPDRNASDHVWKNGWRDIGTGFYVEGMGRTAAGVTVNEESALGISAIFACTRALAQTFAMLPAITYRALADGERERATTERIYYKLKDAPNSEMDSMTYWEMQSASCINLGNAYSEIEVDGMGDVLNLWPIHHSRVTPRRNSRKQVEFLVKGNHPDDDVVIPSRRMLNVVGALSRDGITGRGVIQQAVQSAGKAIALDRFTSSFWGNGSKPGGVIKLLDEMEAPDRERLRSEWIAMHQGVDAAGKVAILQKGVEYESFPLNNEQAQLIQSLQFSVEDLARWYGVPPHVIGHLLHATIANVEQEQIGWRQRGILPLAVRFERALKRQIFTPESDLYCEWLLDMIERADTKTRAEATKLEIESGQLTPNEGRRRENKPRYEEGGDKPLFPMNFTTLDRIESGESLKNTASQNPKGPQAEAVAPEVNLLASLNETLLRLVAPKEIKTDDSQAKQLAANTAKRWLDDSWLRMIRREKKQAEAHAVDAKKFGSWLDSYGEQHAALLVETITTPVSAWLSAMSDPREPLAVATSLATQHVTTSHDLLLTACECSAESLSSSVSACVATWETRTVSLDQLQGT